MADITTTEDVALPADKVWEVIGDFNGIQKWATIVQGSELDESTGTTTRVLTMGNGAVAREPLVASSQFSYTYTHEGKSPDEDRGTIAVIPLDASHSRIVLIYHGVPKEGQTEEELETWYGKFGNGNLKAMKRALGLS